MEGRVREGRGTIILEEGPRSGESHWESILVTFRGSKIVLKKGCQKESPGAPKGAARDPKIDKKREKVSSGSESRKRWGKCLKIGGPGPSKTMVFH